MVVDQSEAQSTSSSVPDRLELLLTIMEKKSEYKAEYRPVFWYIFLVLMVLIIIVSMMAVAYLFGSTNFWGWFALVAFIFIVLLIGFIVYFFLDTEGSSHEKLGFRAIERFKELLSLKKDIEDLETALRLHEEMQAQRFPQEHYRTQVPKVIADYQRQAKHYRNYHITFQMLIIILSVLVTAFTSGTAFSSSLDSLIGVRWVAPILSILVSIFAGITAFFKFHDRYYNLQQTADAIELEKTAVDLAIRKYKNMPHEKALVEFAEQVEQIKEEQRKRQLQLEQSSETKKPTSQ